MIIPKTLLVIKTKREFYQQQEKSKCSQKRDSLKNISGLLSRNLTVQERKDGIFKLMGKKAYHPRIFFSGRLFFINEDDIKTFPNKQQLREFIRLVLQDC